MEDRWYSTSEVGLRVGMSIRGIRRLIQRGEIRATWIGGSAGYRIKDSDLEKFLRRRRDRR